VRVRRMVRVVLSRPASCAFIFIPRRARVA
jgi:hypothetical protein